MHYHKSWDFATTAWGTSGSHWLGVPQVHTDLVFIHLSTFPLAAEHAAVKKSLIANEHLSDDLLQLTRYHQQCRNDNVAFNIFPDQICRDKELPEWYTALQITLIKDFFFSKVTIDRVTIFGVCPAELWVAFRTICNYFHCFSRDKHSIATNSEELDKDTTVNLDNCHWIDGLGHYACLRFGAFDEFHIFLSSLTTSELTGPTGNAYNLLIQMVVYQHSMGFVDESTVGDDPAKQNWLCLQSTFVELGLDSDCKRNSMLPLPVYLNIKASNTSWWLFHLLLSMGEYDTKMELLIHPSLRDAFVAAKLFTKMTLKVGR